MTRDLLDCHRDERFERCVLLVMSRDCGFLGQMLAASQAVNGRPVFREFDNPVNRVAALVVSAVHAEQYPGCGFDFPAPAIYPSPSGLLPFIRKAMETVQGVHSTDDCLELLVETLQYPEDGVRGVEPAVRYRTDDWLVGQAVRLLEDKEDIFLPGGAEKVRKLKTALVAKIHGLFPKNGSTDPMERLDMIAKMKVSENMERLPTPWPALDHLCAGGLVRGDTWWIGGARGSGKSTLAGQMAADWLLMGIPGIYVGTEMSAQETAARWLSNVLTLPQDLCGDVIRKSLQDEAEGKRIAGGRYRLNLQRHANVQALDDRQMEIFREFEARAAKHLYFCDWQGQPAHRLMELTETLLARRAPEWFDRQDAGPPQWFIFDWPARLIRGAGDAEAVRNLYKQLVVKIVDLSVPDKGNMTSVVIGQLNQTEAYGKRFLTEANSPDSKQLGTDVQGVACLSNLMDDAAGMEGDRRSRRSEHQILYVSKNRHGNEGHIDLREDFRFARFGC